MKLLFGLIGYLALSAFIVWWLFWRGRKPYIIPRNTPVWVVWDSNALPAHIREVLGDGYIVEYEDRYKGLEYVPRKGSSTHIYGRSGV